MLVRWIAVALLGLAGLADPGDEPRLDQIQVIGTHNSYHVAPHPNVLGLIAAGGKGRAEGLDYTHRPLAEQLDRGIRQVELDLFADPKGGHYAEPSARTILKGLGKDPGPDVDASLPQARPEGLPRPGRRLPIDGPDLRRRPPPDPRLVASPTRGTCRS